MTTTVVGLYDDEATARKAVKALKDKGFENDPIHVEAHGADDSSYARGGNLAETLEREGVPREDAHFYAEGVRRGGSLLILETEDSRAQRAVELMNTHRPIHREGRERDWRERGHTGYDASRKPFTREEAETERKRYRTGESRTEGRTESRTEEKVRLTEAKEEVHVGKRETTSGTARIHKRVKERPVEEKVRLREEKVEVEERPASRARGQADEDVFEEKTIEMKETREEPVVEKETRVTGEVVARKEARERTETVRDTVRETEIDVQDGSDVTAGFGDHERFFREHYQEAYGDGKSDFSAYRPAYRHGFAYGNASQYRDRDFSRAEPEIRRHYERERGEGTFEQVKEAIRHGFRRARAKT